MKKVLWGNGHHKTNSQATHSHPIPPSPRNNSKKPQISTTIRSNRKKNRHENQTSTTQRIQTTNLQTLQNLHLPRRKLPRPNPNQKGTTHRHHLPQLRQTQPHTTKKEREKMLTPKMKRRIKRELNSEKPTIRVGKQGAPQIINEVSRQLDQRKIVKVKILKTALKNDNAKNIASTIAQKTSSTLIDVRGHTFILYKPRRRKSQKPL